MLCFLREDVQLVKRKRRYRPKGATRPILPNDNIPTESGQSIPLDQLDLSTELLTAEIDDALIRVNRSLALLLGLAQQISLTFG